MEEDFRSTKDTGMARRRADRDEPFHSISQARRPRRAVPLFPLFEKGEDN